MLNSLYIENVGFCPIKWDVWEEHDKCRAVFAFDANTDILHYENRKMFFQELFVWLGQWIDKAVTPRKITVLDEEEDLVTEFKDVVPHSILFADNWQIEIEVKYSKTEYYTVYEYCKSDP